MDEKRFTLKQKAWMILGVVIVGAIMILLSLSATMPRQAPVESFAPADTVRQVLVERVHFFLDIDGDGDLDYVTSAWYVANGPTANPAPVPTPEIVPLDPQPGPVK